MVETGSSNNCTRRRGSGCEDRVGMVCAMISASYGVAIVGMCAVTRGDAINKR